MAIASSEAVLKPALPALLEAAGRSPPYPPPLLLHLYVIWSMLLCMRTTIEIADELLRQAKKKAAEESAPLRQVVEEALRLYLRKNKKKTGYRLGWRTERGKLLPGVRLDDRGALFDLMEGRR